MSRHTSPRPGVGAATVSRSVGVPLGMCGTQLLAHLDGEPTHDRERQGTL